MSSVARELGERYSVTTLNLSSFATILATYARTKLAHVHRAALLVRCARDGSVVAAVFGNDDFARNRAARKEVDLVRQQLKEAGVEELAFGLSQDAFSWALLVKVDNEGFQTIAGKTFRTEMLRACLDDAVWTAWNTACGFPAGKNRTAAPEARRHCS